MKKSAIFDLDHTLLKGSSTSYFGKHLFFRGKINPIYIIRLIFWSIEFKMGILDLRKVIENNVQNLLTDISEDFYLNESKITFEKYLKKNIYAETYSKMLEHKKNGYIIILASSTLYYLAQQVGLFLDVDHIIGFRMEYKNGRTTGKAIEPMPYGEGKKHWVIELCEKEKIDLSASYFYSDSDIDLPLLEAVGHPVATNPNKRLVKIARERNWQILNCQKTMKF